MLSVSEKQFENFLLQENNFDSSHDLAHIKRVVTSAKKICENEKADYEIVVTAAWLHDCVVLPKNHPDRKSSSKLAAKKAVDFLSETTFPKIKLKSVHHAIEAHSFSAGVTPETPEAKIVQDADRLDALGAIGIARCFMVGGQLDRPLYDPDDPFCEFRKPDDSEWTLDHFYQKLFKLTKFLNTGSAKKEAEERIRFMKRFLDQLRSEV